MKIMNSVRLTANQKRVLAKIFASPTAKVAGSEISDNENMAGARRQLERLGAIEYVAGEASVTDKGTELAKSENIIDDAGQLTPDGEALAYTNPQGTEDKDVTKAPPTTPPVGVGAGMQQPPGGGDVGATAGEGGGGMGLTMSYEPSYQSMKLLQELLGEARRPRMMPSTARRRSVQFMQKKQEPNGPATFDPASKMSTVKTTGGVLPISFKKFYSTIKS